jgi:hypothetical protein
MLAALLMLGGAWAEDADVPSLSTQIKRGLSAGVRSEHGRVHITRVRLFPAVVAMSEEEIAAHLASDEPLSVGIMETREHGRLRVTCHGETCTGASGSATVELTLVRKPPDDESPPMSARPAKGS